MNILIDASALMSVLIDEPEKQFVFTVTRDCELIAPSIMPFEIGNALTRLKKRKILNEKQVISAYNEFIKIPLRLLEPDIEKAIKIACKYNIYAYDAYYLEIACRFNVPLLTLDISMKKIAIDLNLRVLEVENEDL